MTPLAVVAGGRGYIGRRVVDALARRDVPVEVVSRADHGEMFERLRIDNPQAIVVNLTRPDEHDEDAALRRLIEESVRSSLPFVHLGSLAERARPDGESPYARAKIRQRRLLAGAVPRLVHVCCGIVFPGNPRLRVDLSCVEELIARCPRVGWAVELACVDEARLAETLAEIVERIAAQSWSFRPGGGDVVILDRRITLADLVAACGGHVDRSPPRWCSRAEVEALARSFREPPRTALRCRLAQYLQIAAIDDPGQRRRANHHCLAVPRRAPDERWRGRGHAIDYCLWHGARRSVLRVEGGQR